MTYPSAPVMGYSVYSGSLDEIRFDERLTVINTLNAYSFVTAEKDAVFKKALQSSDILIADGFPIVIAARLLGGYNIWFMFFPGIKCTNTGKDQKAYCYRVS
jgi:UDP-N-acetyl-D-mannosaminuronic acid transferase (WecB/TagA/CpsF family)